MRKVIGSCCWRTDDTFTSGSCSAWSGQGIRVGVVRILLSSAVRIWATFCAQSEQQHTVAIKFEDLMQPTVGDPYAVCVVDKYPVRNDKSMVTSEAA